MDKLTKAVQAFYEAYPYPTGLSAFDAEIDPARLLIESSVGEPETGQPWQVLEAGCGCAQGLIAAAQRHADMLFTGVDINRVGIQRAQTQATAMGLDNIRFQPADLMTLTDLTAPPGGFDLIYAFGVLHHLSDPAVGLTHLATLLAPSGMMVCMVYGRFGREPLQRLLEAIELATDPAAAIETRIDPARWLAEVADASLFQQTPWEGTARVDDVEFVDRCLHVNEQSYDIESLWQLMAQAGLRFHRWLKPADWSLDALIKHTEARALLFGLSKQDQYKVVERLFQRPRLEWLMTPAGQSQVQQDDSIGG